jgi:hypothetical protein
MTRPFDKPVARIGLFHFATNHRDPIGSLTDALSKNDDTGNSLIVLPEAFNNGRFTATKLLDCPCSGQTIFWIALPASQGSGTSFLLWGC